MIYRVFEIRNLDSKLGWVGLEKIKAPSYHTQNSENRCQFKNFVSTSRLTAVSKKDYLKPVLSCRA